VPGSLPSRPANPAAYFPGLDGLRAISVAAVLIYHARLTWLPGGFLGVEVFFVVSGYLITLLLTREFSRTSTISLRSFWLRRARRLLAAVYALLAVVAVIVLVFYREESATLAAQVWSALGYVTNWYFVASEQSYFAVVERPPVFQHLWSLAIEEQFYLVWPVIILGLCKLIWSRTLIALVIFAGAVASLAWMAILYDPVADPSRVYYGTDTRASGLLMGAALALLWRPAPTWTREPKRTVTSLDLVGGVALVVLASCFLRLEEFDAFLYQGGFAVVSIATLVVIMAAVHPSTAIGRLLARPALTWIGVRSYSLYLWHWPIFVFTRPGIDQPLGLYPTLVVRLVLTVIAAELSYRYVEVPIRSGAIGRWRRRLAAHDDARRKASPIAFAGVAVLLLVAVTTLGGGKSEGEQLLVSQQVVPPAGAVVEAAANESAAGSPTAAPDSVTAGAATSDTPSSTPASTPVAAASGTSAAGTGGAQPGDTITVLGDSVLLGAEEQMSDEFVAAGYGVDYRVKPAWMLDEASEELAATGQPVGSTVVINLGHNTLWERDRANFDNWAGEFDRDADELLATLRDLGAERFVWVNMGVPDRSLVPELGQRQYDLYLWYFPYVNERLAVLLDRHSDVMLADWAALANQPGLTYDAMHLTGDGIRLMIDTVRAAGGF